jgi:glycosyltransferase involved in cell wall biosynthesis
MLIADAPDEFAVAILRLLADQRAGGSLTHHLGQNAYRFVAANYTWERITPIFDRLYAELQASLTAINPRPLAPLSSGTHHDQPGVKP